MSIRCSSTPRRRSPAGAKSGASPRSSPTISFKVETDTLLGTLDYGRIRIATGTMGYKYQTLDRPTMMRDLAEPNYLLKIVPHVDCTPRIMRAGALPASRR